MSGGAEPERSIEAVWRIESARLIAGLARMCGDVGLAEDLAQDALVAALERWPEAGVPDNPGAWLMATAKNRAIDLARRGRRLVELNRAVAIGMAFGPAAGLELVDTLVEAGDLTDHHFLFSVRADLLAKLDRAEEARAEFERAAALTENAREADRKKRERGAWRIRRGTRRHRDRSRRQCLVSDGFLHRVQEFSASGTYLNQFGVFGVGNGQFRAPGGLATDARGDLYVVDHNNFRIQKFGEPSTAFSLGGKATRDQQGGTARLFADLPGVGRLIASGAQIENAGRTAKGAGRIALPVIPNGETQAKLDATGRASVEVQVTYTPTTPGAAASVTHSKRVTLIELPSLAMAVFDGASLHIRIECPRRFEPRCAGRTAAVTARDGTPMTTSASARQKPGESKVVVLKVKPEFRRRVAEMAKHPGRKQLLVRQLIHAKGVRHNSPQVVYRTYEISWGT